MHTNRRHHISVGDSDLPETGFAAGVDPQRRSVIVFRWLNMNSRRRASIVYGCLLGLMAAGITTCNGQAPQFLREVPIGNDYFGLVIQAGTDGWVSLESSTDLRTWSEVASIATTNGVSLFVDGVNVDTGERFYRLRVPGTTVEEAQARWLASGVRVYRFQLERISVNQPPYVLTGTVTVTKGQKIVRNAIGDGQPVDQPDPADFPSIEELYAALNSAQLSGCREVYALYDAVLGFPSRCLIDQRIAAYPPADAGNGVAYHVTGLEVLGKSASANQAVQRTGAGRIAQRKMRTLLAAGSRR